MGLLRPDAGEVLWDGRPMTAADRRRFGYMPEERGLYPKQTVLDQLVYLGRLSGMSDRRARARQVDEPPRAVRPRRARQGPRRDALARQPAARADRRRADAPAARPRARRAVQRARPGAVDAMADLLREHAASRRAGPLLLPPARPRRAALRPPRRAGPRPGRRAGRGRRPARRRPDPLPARDRCRRRLGARRARHPRARRRRARPPCSSSSTDGAEQAVLREALGARRGARVPPGRATAGRDLPGGDGMTHRRHERPQPAASRPRGRAPRGRAVRHAWTLVARREIATRLTDRAFLVGTAAHRSRSSPASSPCRRCWPTRVKDYDLVATPAGAAMADSTWPTGPAEIDDKVQRRRVVEVADDAAARAALTDDGGRRLARPGRRRLGARRDDDEVPRDLRVGHRDRGARHDPEPRTPARPAPRRRAHGGLRS